MSNDNQYKSESMQARPMGKVRNIVIGVLAMFACFVALASCGDSIEDKAKPVIEEVYNRNFGDAELWSCVYECQKIANLEEIGPGRYRGTALMKRVDFTADTKRYMEDFRKEVKEGKESSRYTLERLEVEFARLQRGEGCVKSCSVYIEDLGDYISVELH